MASRSPCRPSRLAALINRSTSLGVRCSRGRLSSESGFFRALSGTRRYEVRGTWLVLSGAEGEIATFEAGLE